MTYLPRDFMARVVAWPGPNNPGFVNLHWFPKQGNGMRGRPFRDIDSFMSLAEYTVSRQDIYKEVYFTLSVQLNTGPEMHGKPIALRNAENSTALKAIWIDIDIKEKGYVTLNEAHCGLAEFISSSGIPAPSAICHSGGGCHVYWISNAVLTVEQWTKYAEGLKSEILRLGLKCDAGLTTDVARVLRVPGTINNKIPGQPREVKLVWLGQDYDFDKEPGLARLATIAPVTVTETKPKFDLSMFAGGMAEEFKGGPKEKLSDGISTYDDTPLQMKGVVNNCYHFRECVQTQGRDHAEPLWNLTLMSCTFLERGRELAHVFSSGHPAYSAGETDAKYDQKLVQKNKNKIGWPACTSFEAAGAKCKACAFHGKVKSPLNLATRTQPTIQAVTSAPNLPATIPLPLMLPSNYQLNADNQICEIVSKVPKKGQKKEEVEGLYELLPLFMTEIKEPILEDGCRSIRFKARLGKNVWREVCILEKHFHSEQSLVREFWDKGVKTYPQNHRRIPQFMASWTHLIDEARSRMETLPFGWLTTEDGKVLGFAYGGKLFMHDGTTLPAGIASPNLTKFYNPRGDIKVWFTALKMVTDQNRPALEVIIAHAAAAPLMALTGKNSCVSNAYSYENGIGKTSSQHIGLAIWGVPTMIKDNAQSSSKGITHKMGTIRNLPVYWDEVSDAKKMGQVKDLLGNNTEGGGGTLLQSNRDFHPKDAWRTVVLIGANQSLVQFIINATRETDAHMQRVFEFYVQPGAKTMSEIDASLLISSLDNNCGMMGLKYAEYLGTHSKELEERVKEVAKKFEVEVNQAQEERFRAAVVSTVYVGAEVLNKLGATFHLDAMWDFMVKEFLKQRDVIANAELVAGKSNNSMAALTMFLKHYGESAIWIKKLPLKAKGRPAPIAYLSGPALDRPKPIHIRIAVEDRRIQISRKAFETYLIQQKYVPSAAVDGLGKEYKLEFHSCNLSAGTEFLGGPEKVIDIYVHEGSALENELYKGRNNTIVTVPVISGNPKTNGHLKAITDIVDEAKAQAASDLELVRQVTSDNKSTL